MCRVLGLVTLDMSSSIKAEPQDPSSLLQTPTVKLENPSFYSPPPESAPYPPPPYLLEPLATPLGGTKHAREEETESPPSSVPPKKRKCNLYSEILQEAINSTLM